jgi:hypothetical protein
MSLQDISSEPNGGNDPAGKTFILFEGNRANGTDHDVVDAGAEDRRTASDSSAASWMRALHHWNTKRTDVPYQAEVESFRISG